MTQGKKLDSMRSRLVAWTAGAALLGALASCKKSQPEPDDSAAVVEPGVPTQPVTVRALVDGKPSPARIYLKHGGKAWLPSTQLISFRDHVVFDGQAELQLPAGEYTYEIERGPTYLSKEGTLVVAEGKAASIEVTLERLADPEALGWFAGDLHNHRSAAETPELMRTELLRVAPVVTWWNGMMKYDPAQAEPRLLPHGGVLDQTGGEDERVGGAVMLFRLKEPLKLPEPLMDGERYLHFHGDPRCELPTLTSVAREAKKQTGSHVSLEKPFWWDGPTLVALGMIDSYQLAHNHMRRKLASNRVAWGRECDKQRFSHQVFGAAECSVDIYYQYLELGFRLPPSAGSASGVHLNPLGYDRVYVHTGTFDHDAWWRGLAQGQSFVSNGPLLFVRANQMLPGHTFHVPEGGSLALELDVQLHSQEPIASVELVQNATVISQGVLSNDGRVHFAPVQLSEGGWFLVRARTAEQRTYQFASTAPFYVEAAGGKQRISRRAAEFFEQWIRERVKRMRDETKEPSRLDEMLAPQLEALKIYEQLRQRATVP